MSIRTMTVSAALVAGAMAFSPLQASYMSNCKTLISAWEACKESGGACKAEHQKIVKECKCHRLKQGSWKLVMAAVGKDGVCAPRQITDPPPPPPEPPRRKPVITHGGERAPNDEQRQPN